MKKQFWDLVHNPKKVSANILRESNLEVYHVIDDVLLVIYVPRASREGKPIYINGNMFEGTYRRDWEGDYKCTKEQVKAMFRDQTAETYDMSLVTQFSIDDFDIIRLKSIDFMGLFEKPGSPFCMEKPL